MTPVDVAQLEHRYSSRTATLGIMGMGYVGLPLMLAATGAGFRVIGFDIDLPKVEGLNAGLSPLAHIGHAPIAAARESGRFEATGDFGRIGETDAILICVPTPLGRHKEPDLSYVVGTIEAMAPHLQPGQLIVLESTTWPGTTDEIVRPLVEAAGFHSGSDIFIAYSPEREDPGNSEFRTGTIPKVVGGDGETALRLACTLYRQFVSHVVPVSTPATAEAVKLTENIFRAVNIALVNELKLVLERMDIDIFEVIDAAKTKPFGYMPFYPGPGLGGHCIPIDPFYLTWRAREFGIATKFIELAGEINTAMPQYVLGRAAEALDRQQGKGLSGATVLLLGVAYKKNIDDMRESPALAIWELLRDRDATVTYHDPNVPVIPATREHASLTGSRSVPLDRAVVGAVDLVVIVTDHGSVDYSLVAEAARLVVDTRNVMAPFAARMGSRLARA
jgi:UDP-N-acetyl-D-glucosamine dehydrogenase